MFLFLQYFFDNKFTTVKPCILLSLCPSDKSGQSGAAWLNGRDKAAPLNTSAVWQCGDEIAWGNVENGGGMVPTWPGVGGVQVRLWDYF